MKVNLDIGEFVSVDPEKTLLWKDKNSDSSPEFNNPEIPDKTKKIIGIITGFDFTKVYIQVLTNERIIWVSAESIILIQ